MPRPKSYSLNPIRRKWSKVIQPLLRYQRNGCELNFPLTFYGQLEKMIEAGHSLTLNIPQTLTGAHDNYLYTNFEADEEIGVIKMVPSFSKLKFEAQVEKTIKQCIRKIRSKQIIDQYFQQHDENVNNKTTWFPFVVMKQNLQKNSQGQMNTVLWNSHQYKKISNIQVHQVAQAYIFTKNLTASVTRFFYFPNTNKSVAYKIDNQQSFVNVKKNKQIWKVKQQRQQSCNYIKIMHENKSFFIQTEHLVKNLQKHLNQSIQKIVTDWVIDTENRYYLIDVKQIQAIEAKPRFRITKSLTELLSTVRCSMCLQNCHQSDITKILTNKLINNFYEHLQKRGITLPMRNNCKKINNLSKVCDLCYNLVVEENKLIEAEKKMAIACNFVSASETAAERIDLQISECVTIEKKAYQWRLFFYLEELNNLYDIFKQKQEKYNDLISLYLNFQIEDSSTTFELKSPFKNQQEIKAIKVQHVYSSTLDITSFLQKAQIRVQILPKLNSTRPIAQGSLHGIENSETYASHTALKRKYKQILLFNQHSKYCTLGLYIGICSDGLVTCSGLQFTQSVQISKRVQKCLSLPPQWMEIIDQNYVSVVERAEGEILDEGRQDRREEFSLSEGARVGKSKSKNPEAQLKHSQKVMKLSDKPRRKLVL